MVIDYRFRIISIANAVTTFVPIIRLETSLVKAFANPFFFPARSLGSRDSHHSRDFCAGKSLGGETTNDKILRTKDASQELCLLRRLEYSENFWFNV